MYTVSPNEKERYHLRLLLLNRRGITSYQDLKTLNGVQYETFEEVAEAMGLLKDDREWENCLEEASEFQMPNQLRQLFAVILDNCAPRNPKRLWEKFKPSLIDNPYQNSSTLEELEALAYYNIRDRLQTAAARAVFDTIPPPAPPPETSSNIDYEYERDKAQEMYLKLNQDQRSVVDAVIDAVEDRVQQKQDPDHELTTPSCFFVDGPGGTGKTFVYETIHHILTARRREVIIVASTGIAATLLPNGMTAHKKFELPVPLTSASFLSRIKAGSVEAKALKSVNVCLWDEAPMSPKHAFEGVDILLRDITQNEEVFGGMVFVAGGDFRQCSPVKRFASRADLISLSLKRSELWLKHFHVHRLEQNMRIQEDPDYAAWVLDVGNGNVPQDEFGMIPLPDDIISSGNIVKEIFGESLYPDDPDSYCEKVILTAKNDLSLRINEDVLDLLPTPARVYLSIDSAQVNGDDDTTLYPTEFLNTLTPSGMPPHKLRLKVGAIIILLRNINTKRGLCNGVRLLVIEMRDHVLKCKICCGPRKGQVEFVPRIDISPSDAYLPFTLNRRQFPVRLAFSITINKGQGQTFRKVGAVLTDPAFTHGQLYVCLTRVRSAEDIKILTGFDAKGHRSNKTRNIVYQEML